MQLSRVIEVLRSIAIYQFGPGAERFIPDNVEVVFSKRTGRIRYVLVEGRRIATLRASDCTFALSLDGARLLQKVLPPPRLRVVVAEEIVPFVKRGRDVFCKHVASADPFLRPGDETIVVDSGDQLLAVGRMVVPASVIKQLSRGVAVKVRRGIGMRGDVPRA